MSFFLAPALDRENGLWAEVNRLFPKRDKSSDGWIGDPSHAARVSDHNPDWAASGRYKGIVRAIDIDISPDGRPDVDLRKMLLNTVVGDPRVWYVISNSVIYSVTNGWAARRYTGSNPHTAHVHVSLRHEHREFDTSPWFDEQKRPTQPKKQIKAQVDLSNVSEQFLIALGHEDGKVKPLPGVKHLQRALNAQYDLDLTVDGVVGERTLNAWGRHETKGGVEGFGRPRVPDLPTTAALARGRFRLVA